MGISEMYNTNSRFILHKPVLEPKGEAYLLICKCFELEKEGSLDQLYTLWIDHHNAPEAFADAILKEDIKKRKEEGTEKDAPQVLFKEHLESRDRREYSVDATQIDGTLTNMLKKNSDRPVDVSGDGQMFYNRTHPKGRKVNSKEQRSRHGASYYR